MDRQCSINQELRITVTGIIISRLHKSIFKSPHAPQPVSSVLGSSSTTRHFLLSLVEVSSVAVLGSYSQTFLCFTSTISKGFIRSPRIFVKVFFTGRRCGRHSPCPCCGVCLQTVVEYIDSTFHDIFTRILPNKQHYVHHSFSLTILSHYIPFLLTSLGNTSYFRQNLLGVMISVACSQCRIVS